MNDQQERAKAQVAIHDNLVHRHEIWIEVAAEIGLTEGQTRYCPDWLVRAIMREVDYRIDRWERQRTEIEARLQSANGS